MSGPARNGAAADGAGAHGSSRAAVVVRDAVPADYGEIARITVAAYLAAGHFDDPDAPYVRHMRKVAERHARTDVWVAEREGRIVGSLTLARHGNEYADIAREDELEVRMLVVDPDVQRSGAGRALIGAVLERARATPGIAAVSLTTGTDWHAAHALYGSVGFRRAPERDWHVPGTDILLHVYVLVL
ncbi:N-acetyltransferase [Zafaria cholistanensis]|uniref:N-acetyltransferase n=1 Tax=Zafaria cholistanensis TaxID=1682741 RepID=A0A5A7NPC4_9MICC|nr:GNAT family N-acetyltransferase [Zafaria cholistanensis]GER22640.1 N-acetyltransferase [Zafaria cholistanensis]